MEFKSRLDPPRSLPNMHVVSQTSVLFFRNQCNNEQDIMLPQSQTTLLITSIYVLWCWKEKLHNWWGWYLYGNRFCWVWCMIPCRGLYYSQRLSKPVSSYSPRLANPVSSLGHGDWVMSLKQMDVINQAHPAIFFSYPYHSGLHHSLHHCLGAIEVKMKPPLPKHCVWNNNSYDIKVRNTFKL